METNTNNDQGIGWIFIISFLLGLFLLTNFGSKANAQSSQSQSSSVIQQVRICATSPVETFCCEKTEICPVFMEICQGESIDFNIDAGYVAAFNIQQIYFCPTACVKWTFIGAEPINTPPACNFINNSAYYTVNYPNPGEYFVKLEVFCSPSSSSPIDYTDLLKIVVKGPPTASFDMSGNPPFCNQRVGLNNTTPDASVEYWDMGDGTIYNNVEWLSHKYSLPGTYTIKMKVTNRCGSDIIEKTIKVDGIVPDFSFTNICVNENIQFTDLSNCTGEEINTLIWDFGDGTTSLESNPQHIYAAPGTYNVTLTLSLINDHSITKLITILPCCNITNDYKINGGKVSELSKSTFDIPGQTISINGLLTVDVDLTFTNQFVKLGPDAKILVIGDKKLIIENSTLEAGCGYMWDGIYVNQPQSHVIIKSGSLVKDAKNAIHSVNGGRFTIENSTLDLNYKHIVAKSYAYFHAGTIKGTTIKNTPGSVLLPPFAGKRSLVGMEITEVSKIIVGSPGSISFRNKFENMDYGIVWISNVKKCGATIQNNLFTNINPDASLSPAFYYLNNPGLKGTAILCWGRNPAPQTWPPGKILAPSKIIIGGSSGAKNIINNTRYGIQVLNNLDADVSWNAVNTIGLVGVKAANCRTSNNINIAANQISKAGVAIQCLNNGSSTITINNRNQINANTIGYASLGIHIVENSTNTKAKYIVDDNKIDFTHYGIHATNISNESEITKNEIEIKTTASANQPAAGIYLSNVRVVSVRENYVLAENKNNFWIDGIRSDAGTGNNKFICNETEKTGNGLTFNGPQPNTVLIKNRMDNNKIGLYLNNDGLIGTQQTGNGNFNEPNDNEWKGDYSGSNYHTFCEYSFGDDSHFLINQNDNKFIPTHNDNDPDPPLASPVTFTLESKSNTGSCTSSDHTDGGGTSEETIKRIVREEISFPKYQEEARWRSKEAAYHKIIKDNSTDPELVTFKDEMGLKPMGKLIEVDKVIHKSEATTDELEEARIKNEAIITENDIEENYKEMNRIKAELDLGMITMNEGLMNAIKTIAEKCPFSDGPGVYHARALMESLSENPMIIKHSCELNIPNGQDAQMAFNQGNSNDNSNENEEIQWNESLINGIPQIKTKEKFHLVPNPNNGNFIINYSFNFDEQGEFHVMDLTGKLIHKINLDKGNNSISIKEETLSEGYYLYKVLINGKLVVSDKLIVVR